MILLILVKVELIEREGGLAILGIDKKIHALLHFPSQSPTRKNLMKIAIEYDYNARHIPCRII